MLELRLPTALSRLNIRMAPSSPSRPASESCWWSHDRQSANQQYVGRAASRTGAHATVEVTAYDLANGAFFGKFSPLNLPDFAAVQNVLICPERRLLRDSKMSGVEAKADSKSIASFGRDLPTSEVEHSNLLCTYRPDGS